MRRRWCGVVVLSALLLFLLLLAAPSSASSASSPSPFTGLLHALRLSSAGDSPPSPHERERAVILSIRTSPSFAPPKPDLHALSPASSDVAADEVASSSPLTSTTVWAVALVLTLIGVILLFGTYLAVSM